MRDTFGHLIKYVATGSSETATATVSSLAQLSAAVTDADMDIGRPNSSDEDVPASGSARQVDSSEQEIRTELIPSWLGAVVAGDPAAVAAQKRKSEAGPTPSQPKANTKKKAKRASAAGAYFTQAEQADLLGVVLVRGQPYAVLDRDLVARLRELITDSPG